MNKIDLHIHTTASDGSLTPEEVVAEAKQRDLTAIAITDHDTVGAVAPAIKAGKEENIEVVSGIEFTTYYQGERIDILGYYIDHTHPQLSEIIDNLQNARQVRAEQILDKLAELKVELDFSKLQELAGETGIGRPYIARLMVQEGYVEDMQQAFDDYLEDGGPAYVPKYQLQPEDAIRLITHAGGIPVLAHPGVIADREIVKELIDYDGLGGIEAYYSTHDEEETEYYLDLAQQYDLLVTGGSDCHGPANPDKFLLGTVEVPYSLLTELKK